RVERNPGHMEALGPSGLERRAAHRQRVRERRRRNVDIDAAGERGKGSALAAPIAVAVAFENEARPVHAFQQQRAERPVGFETYFVAGAEGEAVIRADDGAPGEDAVTGFGEMKVLEARPLDGPPANGAVKRHRGQRVLAKAAVTST